MNGPLLQRPERHEPEETPGRKECSAGECWPRQPRYRSLDLWRGVACLFVVVCHATKVHRETIDDLGTTGSASGVLSWLLEITRRMEIGVPLFFVISGYCIAATADSTRRRSQTVGSYFVRRFRRIYPPLWICTLCLIAIHFGIDFVLFPGSLSSEPWPQFRPWWFSGQQWLGNLTLTETWLHYLVGGQRLHFPSQAWTLCYEEQFYAVTGLLLFLASRHFFQAATIFTGLTIALMLSCAWVELPVLGFFFDGSWLTFAAGVLVYYQINYAGPKQKLMLLGVLLLATGWSFAEPDRIPGGQPAFCFAMLILALHRWDRQLATTPVLRPLMYCGTLCYSLYLVHVEPVKAISYGLHRFGLRDELSTLLIVVPVCVAVSVGLAWFFHWAVESRFLNEARQDVRWQPKNGERV